MIACVLAVALVSQASHPSSFIPHPSGEAPPRVRIVSLPDSYAPDLAPGEVLVPGSVYDVVPEGAAESPPPASRPVAAYQAPPSPSPPATPYGSSCYASSYQSIAPSYQAPAPAATYVIPSVRPPVYSTPIDSTPAYAPQYAEPVPTARPRRRGRFALRARILMDHEVRNHLELGAGIGDGARGWDGGLFSRGVSSYGYRGAGGCPGGCP
jgi:hypothetical protein